MSTEVTPPKQTVSYSAGITRRLNLFKGGINYSLGGRGKGQGSGEEHGREAVV